MIELYYDAKSLAWYIAERNMTIQEQMHFLDWIFSQESECLHPDFRGNKRKFKLDMLYAQRSVEREAEEETLEMSVKRYFMFMRLNLLYAGGNDYTKIKLSRLLKQFGYERRSAIVMDLIRDCLFFYHIQPHLRGGEMCDLRDIKVGDMVSFRVL